MDAQWAERRVCCINPLEFFYKIINYFIINDLLLFILSVSLYKILGIVYIKKENLQICNIVHFWLTYTFARFINYLFFYSTYTQSIYVYKNLKQVKCFVNSKFLINKYNTYFLKIIKEYTLVSKANCTFIKIFNLNLKIKGLELIFF